LCTFKQFYTVPEILKADSNRPSKYPDPDVLFNFTPSLSLLKKETYIMSKSYMLQNLYVGMIHKHLKLKEFKNLELTHIYNFFLVITCLAGTILGALEFTIGKRNAPFELRMGVCYYLQVKTIQNIYF